MLFIAACCCRINDEKTYEVLCYSLSMEMRSIIVCVHAVGRVVLYLLVRVRVISYGFSFLGRRFGGAQIGL